MRAEAKGCKLLERGRVVHPDGSSGPLPRYYSIEDARTWSVGSEIRINASVFFVTRRDEFTAALQAGEATLLDLDRELVLSQMQQQMMKVGITLRDKFTFCDRKDDGIVTADELDLALKALGIKVSEAEVHDSIAFYDISVCQSNTAH